MYRHAPHHWAALACTFVIRPNSDHEDYPCKKDIPQGLDKKDQALWMEAAIAEWQSEVSYEGCLRADNRDWRAAVQAVRAQFPLCWNTHVAPKITSQMVLRPCVLSSTPYTHLRFILHESKT